MLILKNVAELDEMIAKCDRAQTDDELRSILGSFSMHPQPSSASNPFSLEYRVGQMKLYEAISGRTYSLANEATPFDVEQAAIAPFPYSTRSCQTAGDHLVVMGEFIRRLRLPAEAKIVEFGPGWGNLTLALAALGFQVTCVDVEPRFCELIERRAKMMNLEINVINDDFGWAERTTETFDAAIFFECFHHAADHLGLLRDLHSIVRPSGRVYLGAEPILDSFPLPWGLRLDGQSLWSIRKFGWMELGFQDDYFRKAMRETEWDGFRHDVVQPAIWELTSARLPRVFDAASSKLGSLTGRISGRSLYFDAAEGGVAMFGPYISLPAGSYVAKINAVADTPLNGTAIIDVCAQAASEVIARREVDLSSLGKPIELAFETSSTRLDVEVRFFNPKGFSGRIDSLEIHRL